MFHVRQVGKRSGVAHKYEFFSTLDRQAYLGYNGGEIHGMSRCPYPYWKRPDIMRDIHFGDIAQMQWVSSGLVRQHLVVSPSRKLRMVETGMDTIMEIRDKTVYSDTAIRVVAAMSQLITAATYHIVAVVAPHKPQQVKDTIWALFEAGVLEKSADDWKHQENFGEIWHFNPSSLGLKRWLQVVGNWEAGLILGSTFYKDPPGANSPLATRHALLMTEVLVRATEFCDNVAGFFGEQVLPAKAFYRAARGDMERLSHGDGAIVTKDGKVVVFELVGGSSTSAYAQSVIEKSASWTAACGSSDIDMSVVFINATFAVTWRDMFKAVNIGVKQESKRYISNPIARERGGAKIYVADAARWFPESQSIAMPFSRMLCWSPIYNCLVDPFIPDPQMSSAQTRQNIVLNTALALHQPTWVFDKRLKQKLYGGIPTESFEAAASAYADEVVQDILSKKNHPQKRWLGKDGKPRRLDMSGLGDFH